MSQENYNKSRQNDNEEVDLIRLLNYFKNGIKSIFRGIGRLIMYVVEFIILLKAYWILVVSLILLGAIFGKFIKPMLNGGTATKSYEMVVKTNPISNYELYALANEIKNQNADNSNENEEGVKFAKSLGIKSMEIEALPQIDDAVKKYYEQTELKTTREFLTDTLFYQGFELKNFDSNLKDTDYALQKVRMKVVNETLPKNIQAKMIEYLNNLPGIKREQSAKIEALSAVENNLQRNLQNIDSLLVSRAVANKNSKTSTPVDQTLVNSATKSNLEADLLNYADRFNTRLYSTLLAKSEIEKGVQVVSNLRAVGNQSALDSPLIKYTLLGFVLACIIILIIQFNKYLTEYDRKKIR